MLELNQNVSIYSIPSIPSHPMKVSVNQIAIKKKAVNKLLQSFYNKIKKKILTRQYLLKVMKKISLKSIKYKFTQHNLLIIIIYN